MKRVAVFCGSSAGTNPIYLSEAYQLGKFLSLSDMELVYGGAKVGLMGAVADGAIQNNGKAIGVIPNFLKTKEIAHETLTELISVGSMHERKTKMYELSDGIIALSGGFGTLDELFEILTWAQLGLHQKPIGLLNINGYFDALILLIQKMVDEGFLSKLNQDMLLVDNQIPDLIVKMKNYQAPNVKKWIDIEKS